MSWKRRSSRCWVGLRGYWLWRLPRPIVEGVPTGGWWVLYRNDRVIKTFEFRRDQWRHPPWTWVNEQVRADA